jgi:4a-hydroxytetrahydrobiopterin dehydratase
VGVAKLSEAEIAVELEKLRGWSRDGDLIRKAYTFSTFAEGIRFVDRVAEAADRADHHPDIDVRWTTVTMMLSTHSAGGLTRRDFALAATIDGLARG